MLHSLMDETMYMTYVDHVFENQYVNEYNFMAPLKALLQQSSWSATSITPILGSLIDSTHRPYLVAEGDHT